METYIVLLDRYHSRPAPGRADTRLKIGLTGTLLMSVICSVGPSLSPSPSTHVGHPSAHEVRAAA